MQNNAKQQQSFIANLQNEKEIQEKNIEQMKKQVEARDQELTQVKGQVANLEIVVNELKAKLDRTDEDRQREEPKNQSSKPKQARFSQPPNFKQPQYNSSGSKNQKPAFQNQKEGEKANQNGKPDKFGRYFQQTCAELNQEDKKFVHPSRLNNLPTHYTADKVPVKSFNNISQRQSSKKAESKPVASSQQTPLQSAQHPAACTNSSFDEEDEYCIVPMKAKNDCSKSQASIPAVDSSQIQTES